MRVSGCRKLLDPHDVKQVDLDGAVVDRAVPFVRDSDDSRTPTYHDQVWMPDVISCARCQNKAKRLEWLPSCCLVDFFMGHGILLRVLFYCELADANSRA